MVICEIGSCLVVVRVFDFLFIGGAWWASMDRPAGMDMPIMHDSDRYELVKDIGSGNFGVARLMRDRQTNELVAVKYIERGEKVLSCTSPVLLHLLIKRFGWWS